MDITNTTSIYHYTKVDTLLRYILPQMKLRMNPLANTNDPTEALWPLLDKDFNPDQLYYEKLSQVKSLSFCIRKFLTKEIFIDGFEIHPMWAHYAENWGGVCLEIDYEKFIANNERLISNHDIRHKQIEYVDFFNREDIPRRDLMSLNINYHQMDAKEYVSYLIHKIEGFVDDRFFKKDLSWCYEQESRFIALKDYEEEVHLKLDGSIKKIILGPRFNIHLRPAVRELIQKNDLDDKIIIEGVVDARGQIKQYLV